MNSSGAAGSGFRPPFTAAQWQELEHQALIFKYLAAGIPVPPELLLPIRKSFESMAARFYHPTMGYYSFYGKKFDPEPGRCRRTDGKKWRCSKDAYPDSKYCERHMHRGRNRSRKPVEMQNLSQSQSSLSSTASSTVTSLALAGGGISAGFGGGSGGRLPSGIPLQHLGGGGSNSATQVTFAGSCYNQLQMDPGSYEMDSKNNRYLHDVKHEVNGHGFFSDVSGISREPGINPSLEGSSRLMPSQVPSFSFSKSRIDSLLPESYAQLQSMQALGRLTASSLAKKQQQHHCFFGRDFNSSEPVKQENNSVRPFFNEWPKTRGSWSVLEDEISNRSSFSATQLSISLPLASDFSSSSKSANGVS